ncbi:hypothetical protein DH2020_022859 [Rehmannia glutinosa]|uniref:Uncharacterized protein n=1 Tax=Rehmannia glutinosa TaxID=99300 RepID=A0ABR0W714_REHGL
MSMMGELTFFLRLQVKQLKDGTFISQTKYTRDLMKKFGMEEKSSMKIPMNTSVKMDMDADGKVRDPTLYRTIVGSLVYLTITRPDIAYAVHIVSRFTSNPSHEHWKALTKVLKYLKYTLEYGLYYSRYSVVLEGYSDASWILDSKDSYSTSGYIFIIGGCAVSWKSTK